MPRFDSSATAVLLGFLAALTSAMATPAPSRAGPAAAVRSEPATVRVQLRAQAQASAERRRRMNSIQSWGYWLSSLAIDAVSGAPHDLLVIDNAVSANRQLDGDRRGE